MASVAPDTTDTTDTTPGPGSTVFTPAGTTYHTFRIPALLAIPGSPEPTLLAFCEGRIESSGDSGPIELVLRRSLDGGRSWQPVQVVCRAPEQTCGNPVPILDPTSGDVVLLTTRNGARVDETAISTGDAAPEDSRRVFVQRSADQGRTWTEPREITGDVRRDDWGWYATGPCHGIALQHGEHAGRLVVPANHSVIPAAGPLDASTLPQYSGGHCILSDDGGHSWRVGFVADYPGNELNPNETTVAELADGRLIFNTRNHRGTAAARLQAVSADGGRTLTTPYSPCQEITAPGIQGSLIAVNGQTLILSTPSSPTSRTQLLIFTAEDAGPWRRGAMITAGPAGYSDLADLGGDRIGLLYETGAQESTEEIRFLSRSRTQLMANVE